MTRRAGLFAIELIELILGILSVGILLGLTCAIASGEEGSPVGDVTPQFGSVGDEVYVTQWGNITDI